MKKIQLKDINIKKPDFINSTIPKQELITSWIIDMIKNLLDYGIADYNDFLPSKDDLAKYLDVSTSTIQISLKQVKNLGYIDSKQSKGSYIKDIYSNDIKEETCLCMNSLAECKIKNIILEERYPLNSIIPTISELSKKTTLSQNTIRFALMNLYKKGYLDRKHLRGNKFIWIYKKEFVLTKDEIINGIKDENCTLTHQLITKIKSYLEKTYKPGEKILPNKSLSNMFDVSVKTVNDAMKTLNQEKIILSRRGKYGTIYLGNKNSKKTSYISSERKKINVIPSYNYSWQKALHHLKKYIIDTYEIGDKIKPIRELALILDVSPNTIRRALNSLKQNGYIISKRGKYGGIFIIDMPQIEEMETYKWLALNPDIIDDLN